MPNLPMGMTPEGARELMNNPGMNAYMDQILNNPDSFNAHMNNPMIKE